MVARPGLPCDQMGETRYHPNDGSNRMRASPTCVRRSETLRLSTLVVRALLGVASVAAGACSSDESGVVQARDKIVGSAPTTTANSQPAPAPETSDSGGASTYGVEDDGGYATGYTVSPVSVCNQCACGAGTYCFGGGTGYTAFNGTCTDAGSQFGIGCQALPAACATKPDCDCLFTALKPQIPCYLVCAGVGDLTVYCPNP
jgi:hypothetical protein